LAGGLITANFTYIQLGFYTPQWGLLPPYISTAPDIFTVLAVPATLPAFITPAGPVILVGFVIIIKIMGVTCVIEIAGVAKAAGAAKTA